MMSRLQMAIYAVCLLCGLASVSSKAWWQAASEPREQYRHLMPMGPDFPGIPLPGAERVTQTIRFALHPRDLSDLRLDCHPRNRQGTGLYRVPGEPVTVSVRRVDEEPQALARGRGKRPQLLIGAHPWLPLPEEDRQHGDAASARQWLPLLEDRQKDKGGASGLIYIDAGARGHEVFDITIEGAVRAPWFKLGRDTQEHWRKTLRHAPAPWAELEGDRAILTLPSSMIRDLEDPEPIIRFYDQIVQDVNTLVGLSDSAQDLRDRSPDLPFRLVLDPALSLPATQNIAAASGYPVLLNWIHAGDPWIWLQPDSPQVRALVLHELGHNYEPVDQLFEPPGAVEAFADLIQYGWQSRAGYTLLGSRTGWPGFKDDMYYAWLPLIRLSVVFLHHCLQRAVRLRQPHLGRGLQGVLGTKARLHDQAGEHICPMSSLPDSTTAFVIHRKKPCPTRMTRSKRRTSFLNCCVR